MDDGFGAIWDFDLRTWNWELDCFRILNDVERVQIVSDRPVIKLVIAPQSANRQIEDGAMTRL